MAFGQHENKEILNLYLSSPWQGQDPENAKILIVSHDANYAPDIDLSIIREYHNNGVAFWAKNGIHHPFLKSEYKRDGRTFHNTFASIGLDTSYADHISFVEVLHYPTSGSIGSQKVDYDEGHFHWLDQMIQQSDLTFILGTRTFNALKSRQAQNWGTFKWLSREPVGHDGSLKVHFKSPQRTTFHHYHYSCQPPQRKIMINQQIPDIRRVINSWKQESQP